MKPTNRRTAIKLTSQARIAHRQRVVESGRAFGKAEREEEAGGRSAVAARDGCAAREGRAFCLPYAAGRLRGFPGNVGGADALVEAVKEVGKKPCLP
jgi:hypothetical protein